MHTVLSFQGPLLLIVGTDKFISLSFVISNSAGPFCEILFIFCFFSGDADGDSPPFVIFRIKSK